MPRSLNAWTPLPTADVPPAEAPPAETQPAEAQHNSEKDADLGLVAKVKFFNDLLSCRRACLFYLDAG